MTMSDRATVSAAVLGGWLACSAAEVRRLAQLGVLVRAASGFDLKASVQAYTAYLRRRQAAGSHWEGKGPYAVQRVRLTTAKADLAEMERQRRAGMLLEASDVKRAWLSILLVVRSRLLAMPARLAPRLAGKTGPEIAALVKQEVYEILNFLQKTQIMATAPNSVGKDTEATNN